MICIAYRPVAKYLFIDAARKIKLGFVTCKENNISGNIPKDIATYKIQKKKKKISEY